MPLENKLDAVRAKLDGAAADSVLLNPQDSILAAPADPASDEMAFADGVYRYVSAWLADHASTVAASKPFAFVLSRSIAEDEQKLIAAGATPITYQAFKSQKMIDVVEHVIVVTMNLEKALAVPVSAAVNGQSLLDAVKNFGFSDRHVAVFEPPVANLFFVMPGLSESRSVGVQASGTCNPWSLQSLEDEITKFHCTFTRTPSGWLVPWKSAKQGQTGDQLEVRISKFLAYVLGKNWTQGSVLAEVTTSSGRIDVFLHSVVLESGHGPCVIEVKVLRSHSNRRKYPAELATWWAEKGAVQASIYRQDMSAPTAYLLCFDAREEDQLMPEVDAASTALNVLFRKYFMYRSADALQAATQAKIASG